MYFKYRDRRSLRKQSNQFQLAYKYQEQMSVNIHYLTEQ